MARTKATPRLNVSAILRHLGGAPAIRRKLDLMGFEAVPTEPQMRKWVQRKMIPGDWLVVLLMQAKDEGRPIEIADFVRAA